MEVDMKLLKVIIISISIFVFSINANGQDLKETKGTFGEMPFPVFFSNDYDISVPTFLFRYTQYIKFRLKKDEKKEFIKSVNSVSDVLKVAKKLI